MANEQTGQTLFRKKSLDRVPSPEQLNEYIRVANPSVWVLMAAIVILLVGICVWGVLGHLDTTLPAAAVAEEGTLTLYIQDTQIDRVQAGMQVMVDGQKQEILTIGQTPVPVEDQLSAYAIHVGGLQAGQWVYGAQVSGNFSDGVYSAQIIVDTVSPMSFVLN